MANGTEKTTVICQLTSDWQERKSDSHLAKSEIMRFRYVVACFHKFWALCFESATSSIIQNRKFAARFADLAPTFKSVAGVDPVDGLQRVADGLKELTGKEITFDHKGLKGAELWVELGRQIDQFYDVDHNASQDDVRTKLFGEMKEEGEEDNG